MDALDRIVREVERDLQKWADAPLLHEAKEEEQEEVISMETVFCTCSAESEGTGGYGHQKCGGGRRVMKRPRSSS